jgi:hypothetical protein
VVDLPSRKVGTTDVPMLAYSVRCQDERAFVCANQDPYPTHLFTPSDVLLSIVDRAASRSTCPRKK